LACGIGLPIDPVDDDMNGLRIGTPEIVRWGVSEADIPEIAALLARALKSNAPEDMASEVANLRGKFRHGNPFDDPFCFDVAGRHLGICRNI
jgi:glycine hydroxymethyltransferase